MKLEYKGTRPYKKNKHDAGSDLYANKLTLSQKKKQIVYYTNTFINIPHGYVGLVFPRSSVRKTCLTMANSVGVIDSGYTGEIQVTFNYNELGDFYQTGDRIAQLVIMPFVSPEFVYVDEFEETERGDSGHGSTGK